jgi:hypothetical protein
MHWVRFAKCADRDSMWLRFVNSGIGPVSGWLRFARYENRVRAKLASFGAFFETSKMLIRPYNRYRDPRSLSSVRFRDPDGFVRRICIAGFSQNDLGVHRYQMLDAASDAGRLVIVMPRAPRDSSHITFIGDMSGKT